MGVGSSKHKVGKKFQENILIKNTFIHFGTKLSQTDFDNIEKSNMLNVITPFAKIVGPKCFNNFTALRFVYIPKVQQIEMCGFNLCTTLRKIVGQPKQLDDNAFNNCYSLSVIDLSQVEEFGAMCLNSCFSIVQIFNRKALKINSCLSQCYSLQMVDFKVAQSVSVEKCHNLRYANVPCDLVIDNAKVRKMPHVLTEQKMKKLVTKNQVLRKYVEKQYDGSFDNVFYSPHQTVPKLPTFIFGLICQNVTEIHEEAFQKNYILHFVIAFKCEVISKGAFQWCIEEGVLEVAKDHL